MKPLHAKSDLLRDICLAISDGELTRASALARAEYPFNPIKTVKRTFNPTAATRVFIEDGFVDRYTGTRLLFPGVLAILSRLMPEEFPAHPNWKMSESHMMYWELFPTVDHLFPIARGGADSRENWVTTSMLVNGAKANWTLDELGWKLLPPGSIHEWDGMLRWFLDFTALHPEHLADNYLKNWHAAGARAYPS